VTGRTVRSGGSRPDAQEEGRVSGTGATVPAPRDGQPGGPDPVEAGWADYVAAARQLDGVRRAAATAASEQARSVAAAREELTAVRERLAPR
jgi:hypothetical protein